MKICPSCGKSEKQFIGSFCIDCFAKQPLVQVSDKNIEILLCPKCGRAKSGGGWSEFTPQMLEELVLRKSKSRFPFALRVSFVRQKKNLDVNAAFTLGVEGSEVVQQKKITIPLTKALCLDCTRESGGYKEAIVQIRGDERKAQRVVRSLEQAIEGKTFWKTEWKKTGGADLIAGSKNVVLNAVRSLRKPFKLSHKLAGVKNGKKVFLVTVLIIV